MTAGMPRVAAQDARERQPTSPEKAMYGKGFERVFGTGWVKPAARPQQRADAQLVAADQEAEKALKQAAHRPQPPCIFLSFSRRSCASIDRVAVGRASRRAMPMGSPVSSQ